MLTKGNVLRPVRGLVRLKNGGRGWLVVVLLLLLLLLLRLPFLLRVFFVRSFPVSWLSLVRCGCGTLCEVG